MNSDPLARFLATYEVTSGTVEAWGRTSLTARGLLTAAGRLTVEGGLYRIHDFASSQAATVLVEQAFPACEGRVQCFGFDWLGRQFATSSDRCDDEEAPVFMFEPGTGEVLDIPVPFVEFHDGELVDEGDAALASDWHRVWRSSRGRDLAFEECAGYEVPLFLGGSDADENVAIIDTDVYWALSSQLIRSAGGLSTDARVESVATVRDNGRIRKLFGRK